MPTITGEFEVKMQPETLSEVAGGAGFGRMSLDKQYHGALVATGKGEMLAHMNSELGSGVYLALERVAGTLDGKRGEFLLHHRGIMERGAPSLAVAVVPDSGSGELAGLRGSLNIRIEGGKHYYDFEYELGEAAQA